MTTETKKGLICAVLSAGLTWVIIYLIERDRKSGKVDQPLITDDTIRIAVQAYKSGMDAGEPKENLDEINTQLLEEYGLSVEYKTLDNKFIVRDMSGKKVKEV